VLGHFIGHLPNQAGDNYSSSSELGAEFCQHQSSQEDSGGTEHSGNDGRGGVAVVAAVTNAIRSGQVSAGDAG